MTVATIEEILRQQGANILGSGPVLRDGLSPVPLPTLEAPTFGVEAGPKRPGYNAAFTKPAAPLPTRKTQLPRGASLLNIDAGRHGYPGRPTPGVATLPYGKLDPIPYTEATRLAPLTPAPVPTPAVSAGEVGKNDPVKPGEPYYMAERKNSFAFNDSSYVNPNPSTASIPVPASLAAPQFGTVRPREADSGPTLISIGDPATDPTNPLSRNFDPRAAQLALRQNALDVERANALTAADADLARTDLSGQYGLQERALANAGSLANTQLGGQFGLQERALANTGALDVANVNAQADLAAVAMKNSYDAALEQYKAAVAANDPKAEYYRQQAREIEVRLQLATQAAGQPGSTLERVASLTRSGQDRAPTVFGDSLSGALGVGPGGYVTPITGTPIEQKLQELLAERLAAGTR